MTSKFKCPFCQQELHKDPDGYYSCYTDNCSVMSASGNGASGTESLWTALIQAKQDLKTISAKYAQSQKSVEIARQALENIKNNYEEHTGAESVGFTINWDVAAKKMHDCAEKALAQITHDNSEKANSVEHKETQAD